MKSIREVVYVKWKDGPIVINLDKYKSVGTHVDLYVNGNRVRYLMALELNMLEKKLKNS